MNFAFVLILALLPLLGHTQEEGSSGVDPTIQDERVLDELTESREQRQRELGKVAEVTEKTAEVFDPKMALKKIGYESFTAGAFFNKDALGIMEKALKSSNLKSYPPEVVKEEILKNLQGHPLESFVRGSPNVQNFLVEILRDEKALVGLIQIFKDKDRLNKYLYWWIGIMFAAYYTRKLFVSKFWKGPFRSLARLLFSATISLITVSTFVLIFKPELRPLITIARKYF